MNRQFRDYISATHANVFRLALSKTMVAMLFSVEEKYLSTPYAHCALTTLYRLDDRGLVRGSHRQGYDITDEGKLVCDLLRKAGFQHG